MNRDPGVINSKFFINLFIQYIGKLVFLKFCANKFMKY
jgi:hypothetical protein